MPTWTRLAPTRYRADAGGDRQVSGHYWAVRYTDRTAGAVYDASWYVIEAGPGHYYVEAVYQSTLCQDVNRPGDTETRADQVHRVYPALHSKITAAEQAAQRRAKAHRPADIKWLL